MIYEYPEEPKEQNAAEQTEQEKTSEVIEVDYEAYPPYNFSWFIENKVAAMGWPQTVENLNYLVDVGVDHLITLSPEMRPPILRCKKKLKCTKILISDFNAPTLEQVFKFIEICKRAEMNGEVIGVHCRQGRGRTGTMLACYLVNFKNMTPEGALFTVRMQRPGSCETYEQEELVYHYHSCLQGMIENRDSSHHG